MRPPWAGAYFRKLPFFAEAITCKAALTVMKHLCKKQFRVLSQPCLGSDTAEGRMKTFFSQECRKSSETGGIPVHTVERINDIAQTKGSS